MSDPWKELYTRIVERQQKLKPRAAPTRPTWWLVNALHQAYPDRGTASAANAAYTTRKISYVEFMAIRDMLWRYATVSPDGTLKQPHKLRLERG